MNPTRSQIDAWNPEDLATTARHFANGNTSYIGYLDKMKSGIRDSGSHWSGTAYEAAYDRIVLDCDIGTKIAHEVVELAGILEQARSTVSSHLRVLQSRVADAEAADCSVADDWTVTGQDSLVHSNFIEGALHELIARGLEAESEIRNCADRIRSCGNQLPDDEPSAPDQPTHSQQARDEASASAFHDMFGRYPVSLSDWTTAAALNPNSYLPRYQGLAPSISVALIEPVPNQGVVRTSSFIEQYSVFNRPFYDLGDNRTSDSQFDPENIRVTTYIDFENGIVVMRQNPSIDSNGTVRVGVPEATVWQASDGSVRLNYEAANPFRPSIGSFEAPEGAMPTVHGDVVFHPGQGNPGAPGSTGVTINGTRADYPSFEAYQDSPQGQTHTIVVDPAASGESWGPAFNLWTEHDIGNGREAFSPFQYVFELGPRIPPAVTDLPGTELGSPSEPPRAN